MLLSPCFRESAQAASSLAVRQPDEPQGNQFRIMLEPGCPVVAEIERDGTSSLSFSYSLHPESRPILILQAVSGSRILGPSSVGGFREFVWISSKAHSPPIRNPAGPYKFQK